jgi:hypothetical protein
MTRLLFIFLLFLSLPVDAATYSEAQAACMNKIDSYAPGTFPDARCVDRASELRVCFDTDSAGTGCEQGFFWGYANPTCTLPEVLDPVTHLCAIPDTTCPPGQAKELTESCHTVTCDAEFQHFDENAKTCVGNDVEPAPDCGSQTLQVNWIVPPATESWSCVSSCPAPSVMTGDEVCFQNPSTGDINQAGSGTREADKEKAASNQQNADATSQQIDQQVTSKEADKTATAQTAEQARQAYEQIKNDPNATQAQIDAALQNYAQALVNANNASQKASSAGAAQTGATAEKQIIDDAAGSIGHTVDPANASEIRQGSDEAYQRLLGRLNDAVAGYNTQIPGNGTGDNGTATGSNNGKLPSYTRPSWLDAPTISESTDVLVDALSSFPPIAAMNQLKEFDGGTIPSCPLGFDFTITLFAKVIPVQSNVICELMDSTAPLMQTVSHVLYGLSAVFIFMSS